MKIILDKRGDNFTFSVEREPMPESRFNAACGLAASVVYLASAALCGLPGLITSAAITILFMFFCTATKA